MKIPFPIKGIDENWSYENQPPVTCRAASNVRAYDPATGRATGAQRAGLTEYVSAAVNGTNAVQEMNHVTEANDDFSYADVSPPTEVWEKAMEHAVGGLQYRSAAISSDGFVYTIGGEFPGNWVTRVNGSGAQEMRVNIGPTLPFGGAPPNFPTAIAVATDPLTSERNVYIATGGVPGQSSSVIVKYVEVGGSGLEVKWDDAATPSGFLEIGENILDLSVVIDENGNESLMCITQGGEVFIIAVSDNVPFVATSFPTVGAGSKIARINTTSLLVSSFGASESISKYVNRQGTWQQAWSLPWIGGTGATVLVSGTGYTFWCTGTARAEAFPKGNGSKITWKYTDTLSVGSITNPTKIWEYGAASSAGFAPKIDNAQNLYYINVDSSAARKVFRLSGATPTKDWEYAPGFTGIMQSVLPGMVYPSRETIPEFMYTIAENAGDPTNITIDKARLRLRSISGNTTRSITTIAIANGRAFYKNGSAWTGVGSAGDFTTSLRYVQSTVFNQLIYIVDGINQRFFDPSDNSMTGWTTTKGTLPQGVRMLTVWNGRVILYGDPGDPFNWFMSAYGDATDFDYFPTVTLATQAVAGNTSKSGKCPDLINAIIPFSDDLLIFGCDHEIWRLTGDPMEGGRFDLVSDVTGMAYGRAWCKDDKGVIYFFGSKGGVYGMPPGGIPVSLTEGRRENTLHGINTATNKITLAWDNRARGVHVFVTPFTQAATTHYFWDKRLDAWWDDSFATPSSGTAGDLDPTAVHVVDGDAPGDRAILLGAHDGKVRYIDHVTPATDDGGTAIVSSVTIGPIQPTFGSGIEAKLTATRGVLNDSSGDLNFELYDSDEALSLGTIIHNGVWKAGRNNGIRERMRGSSFWLKLLDRHGAPWAMESVEMDFEAAGRVRNR